MTYLVTADLGAIKILPANEYEEIVQNVACILATRRGTVALDRAFGVSGEYVDAPIAAIQARLTAEIVAAISEQEPRARVEEVRFGGDTVDGLVKVAVLISIIDDNLRGDF